jgi:hypothetical protein
MKIDISKRRLFVQWAVMASLIVTAALLVNRLGYASYIHDDPTHVTYVTLGFFALATVWCGRLAWSLSSGRDPDDIEIDLKLAHYASSLCVSIGLIGTAIGYYLMLKEGGADGEASEIIKRTFSNASIAIVNTVVGGVCGVVIEIQSKFLEHATAKAIKRLDEADEADEEAVPADVPAAEAPKEGGA